MRSAGLCVVIQMKCEKISQSKNQHFGTSTIINHRQAKSHQSILMVMKFFRVWEIGLLASGLVCVRIPHAWRFRDAAKNENMVDAWNADFASPENCFADFNCLHTQSYGNDGFHQLHRNEQFNFHAAENHRTTAHHIRSSPERMNVNFVICLLLSRFSPNAT